MFLTCQAKKVSGQNATGFRLAIPLLALAFAMPHEAFARTTPLGNATQGTSTSSGGANGVISPSGPGVHPGYRLVSFRNAIASNWRFGGFDWLSDGRIVAVLWGQDCSYTNSSCGQSSNSRTYYGDIGQPPDGGGPGSMYFISGTEGAGITTSNVQLAYSGLWEPLGLHVARGGTVDKDTIYVMTKTGVLRFVGTGPYVNGTNPVKVINTCHARRCIADSVAPGIYKSFTTHPPSNYSNAEQTEGTGRRWHHFNYGLVKGDDGFYYAGTGTQYDNANDRYEQGRDRCAVLKMDLSAGTVQVVAGGLRSPNGWGKGPGGDIFFTDIQGNYRSANAIYHYVPGRYYGMRCDTQNPFGHGKGIAESFPVVSIGQGGSAGTDIGYNPAEIVYLTSGPYAGQLLYGDVTFGGIQRVFLEKVANEWQGAVMLFSGGFRAGIGRLKLGADGAIYAGSQSGGPSPASGNWCWGGGGGSNNVGALSADRGGSCNVQHDFFKLVPKDTVVFDLLSVRARATGFELQFTKKVGPSAGNPANYTVQHWVNNMGVQSYGTGYQSGGVQTATVSQVRIHPDSTRVFLQLASMPAASVKPSNNPSTSGSGNVRVVLIRSSGVLAADGSTPWGEPATPGAAPSRISAWYTLNNHSTDTAFAPVSIVDPGLVSPAARFRDLRVRAVRGALELETNFAQPARIILRDLQGRAVASTPAPAGKQTLRLGTAGLSAGRYVVEVRVEGRTFARPVALDQNL